MSSRLRADVEWMDPKHKSLYLGRSGHLAVMSELAARGFRVTIPEIDVGYDVLAILDTKPEITGLQVKSTECRPLKTPGSFKGQINVPLLQLTLGGNLYYIFAFDLDSKWVEYLIFSREKLNRLRVNEGIGNEFSKGKKQYVKFWFTFRADGKDAGVTCGRISLDDYRNAWAVLPNTPEVAGQPAAQAIHGTAQTGVMSALLRMGCNVAAVEADKVLAFQDEYPGFTQIRVLSADTVPAAHAGAFTAEIEVPLAELKLPSQLYYVFTFRIEGRCPEFIIIGRARLDELRLSNDLGTEHEDGTGAQFLTLNFELGLDAVNCGGQPFDQFRHAWGSLPVLALHQA